MKVIKICIVKWEIRRRGQRELQVEEINLAKPMRESTHSLLKQTEGIVVSWLRFLVNFEKENCFEESACLVSLI